MTEEKVFNPADIQVLYEDQDILVIDKPSGLLSVPDGYDPDLPCLGALLKPRYPRIWMVHRLDRETSGVMIFGLNADSHRELNRQFRERLVSKAYQCLAAPTPDWKQLAMREPLRVDADRQHRTRVDMLRGKPAFTLASVERAGVDYALISCVIGTGYRHQIRAHLYFHGLSILGDTLYQHRNLTRALPDVPRLMLHAVRLALRHPRNGRELVFEAPLPKEFAPLLNELPPTARDGDS